MPSASSRFQGVGPGTSIKCRPFITKSAFYHADPQRVPKTAFLCLSNPRSTEYQPIITAFRNRRTDIRGPKPLEDRIPRVPCAMMLFRAADGKDLGVPAASSRPCLGRRCIAVGQGRSARRRCRTGIEDVRPMGDDVGYEADKYASHHTLVDD